MEYYYNEYPENYHVSKEMQLEESGHFLERNHKYFVLVDTGSNEANREHMLRKDIEEEIITKRG